MATSVSREREQLQMGTVLDQETTQVSIVVG